MTDQSLALPVAISRPLSLPWGLLIPALVLVLLVIVALGADLIAPYDPTAQNILARLQAPSLAHLMGTDELGRDLFSRVIVGARVSLTVGVASTLLGAVGGSAIGIAAAYASGWPDEVLMRVMDVLIAFPAVILAMAVVAIAGSTLVNVIWVLAVVQLPVFARLGRSLVLTQTGSEYIGAARTLGVHPLRIVIRHLIPNSMAALIAMAGLMAAGSILNEAALSFLGLGVVIPTPSWGNILASGRGYLLVGAWWYTLFPGLAIFLTVLVFNVLADEARDAFDPQLRAGRRS